MKKIAFRNTSASDIYSTRLVRWCINASNEKVYYIMEALNDAINSRKKVSFQYFTFNVRKEQKLRHDGYTYVFSPFKLIWNSGS